MKLQNILLASALCAPLVPALADAVLLDFNNLSGNALHVLDTYAPQGFHFSDEAFVLRSNKSGNTDGNGGFYTPYPVGGSNTNIGALIISPELPSAGPASFTVSVDQGFGGYVRALAGVTQQSNVSIEAFDKAGHSLGIESLNVSGSTSGCDEQMVCNWSLLSLELGDSTAYSLTVTGMETLAWFDNFEFGALADTGGGDAPEPASLLLAASALSALAWARRRARP